LQQLRGGDSASVGESGSTLSGGQKARIALARAAYQDKSVYLLDDILSAVDLGVARNIFNNCIMGLLRYKTRILCTHNRTFLQRADWIVVMENGTIKEQGKSLERNFLHTNKTTANFAIGVPQDVLKTYNDILEDHDDSSSSTTEQKISKINTE
jgi:ABC-type bacteriocin/lantibiotic exporter with double-glycine peptidase domain